MNDSISLQIEQRERMAQLAKSNYLEEDLEDLLVTTRIAVEVYAWLKVTSTDSLNPNEAEYHCETIFSGIDFFMRTCGNYAALKDTVPSQIHWGALSVSSLSSLIIATYDNFDAENVFFKKCRLLLDLYRMELVFASIVYSYPE